MSEHRRRIERLERTHGTHVNDPQFGFGRIVLPPRLTPKQWILSVQNWECKHNGISSICATCGRPVGLRDDGVVIPCRMCDYIQTYETPKE